MSFVKLMRRFKVIKPLCLLGGTVLFLPQCAPIPSRPAPPAPPPPPSYGRMQPRPLSPTPPPPPGPKKARPSPQRVASLRLVDQGEREVAAGHVNRGISLFERAIAVDGYNARAYRALAEAWLRKGAPRRALGFAQKAEILAHGNPPELRRIYRLEGRIYDRLGNAAKALEYRQKADDL